MFRELFERQLFKEVGGKLTVWFIDVHGHVQGTSRRFSDISGYFSNILRKLLESISKSSRTFSGNYTDAFRELLGRVKRLLEYYQGTFRTCSDNISSVLRTLFEPVEETSLTY